MSSAYIPQGDVLGISIDLADSTEMKSRIAVFAGTDDRLATQLLSQYLAGLAQFERRFLNRAFHDGLDMNRLFLVKTMGDEFWYVYDVLKLAPEKVEAAAVTLLGALLDVADFSVPLVISEDFDWEELLADKLPGPSTVRHGGSHEMNIKCTFDYHGHVLAYTDVRVEAWLRKPPEFLGADSRDPQKVANYMNRLAGTTARVTEAGKLEMAHRSDYVGLGIDRFFRLTKYAMAGFVTVGENVLQLLSLRDEVPEGLPRGSVVRSTQFSKPLGGGSSVDAARAFTLSGSATDMKGISGAYAYRHVLSGMRALDLMMLPIAIDPATDHRDPCITGARYLRSEGLTAGIARRYLQ